MKENKPNTAAVTSDGDRLLESVFSDAELCNAVIDRYLDELASAEHVPIVKGYSALQALPKPKTLDEAKKIVDGG